MRPAGLLVSLVLAAVLAAGCVNPDPNDPEKLRLQQQENGNKGGQSGVQVNVLAALSTSVTSASPRWVAPGSALDVAASAPLNAKGAVSYAWSVGALPGTVAAPDVTLDTGSKSGADYIAPGASESLVFPQAGVFTMHCHPHPKMLSNVTVIDGYQGPSTVEVKIYDFGYAPAHVVIGRNTTVVYNNTGAQPHTATLSSAEPALKLLPLKDAAGNVTLDGSGWQRVRVVAKDADGRVGNATLDVYVGELPQFAPVMKTLTFHAGLGPLAPQAHAVVGPQSSSFLTAYAGTIFLNYTAKDAAAQNGAPANLALVDVHLKASGETQDTLTAAGKEAGALSARAPAGSYSLSFLATQGVMVNVDYTIEVVYDLATPPAPVIVGAGGGGHHH